METGEINVSACFSRRKLIFQKNLFSFVFKMAFTKVDLSKQIVILQKVWISTCNIFNSVILFLTETHKHQREMVLKMLIGDSNKRKNIKKNEQKPLRPGRSNIWWTNILNNKATVEEWRENFCISEALFYTLLRVETIFNKADYQIPKTCVCRNSNCRHPALFS